MNQTKRTDSAKSVITLAAVSLALSGTAYAQGTTATAEQEPQMLPEVEVTGSYIPYAADAPAIPVDIIDATAIQRTGVTTSVLDVVRKSVPQFTSNANLGSDNGNIASGGTNGGARLGLRGRATLVLVDGRRVAVSPVVASNGFQFVNVNLFPLPAIDKIEILKDGASATYGSDAVSGVVNVKLKSDFEGVQVGGTYGFSDNEGNYEERSYYLIAGGKTKNSSVTATYSYSSSDPIFQEQRPFSRGLFRSPTYAGIVNNPTPNANGDIDFYYLNPQYNSPTEALRQLGVPQNGPIPQGGTSPVGWDLPFSQLVSLGIYQGPLLQDDATQFFDLAQYPTLKLQNERQSATTSFKHDFSDSFRVFGSLMYSSTKTFSQLNAQPVSGSVVAANANNPFAATVTARNRFVTFPRQYITEDQFTRGVLGAEIDITDRVKMEVGGNFNYIDADFENRNLIDSTAYTTAVTNGTYNPFARRQAPGVVEGFGGSAYGSYASGLYSGDIRFLFDVVEIPSGMIKIAAGAEHRRETLEYNNDRNSRTGGWLSATPRQPFNAALEVQGYFAETRIPVFSPEQKIPGAYTLELSAAVRHEVYSSTSDPTVPKYTIRWLPFDDQLGFRASYAESFEAPTLYDLNGPVSIGFSSGTRLARYTSTGAPLLDANGRQVVTGSRQYRSRGGSNAALDPATSESWTAGVVYSPKAIKGLKVEIDWYNMDESDLVSTIGLSRILQDVEQFGPASIYAGLVRLGSANEGEVKFDDGAAVSAPGQMTAGSSDAVWVSDQLINIAGLQQTGLDVRATYNFTTESFGSFEFGSTLGWINSFKYKTLPTSSEFDYASSYTETFGTLPRWTTYTYGEWLFKGFRFVAANRFTPRVEDKGFDTDPDPAVENYYDVEAHSVYDFAISYNFSELKLRALDGLTVTLGVNNAFNELTPIVPSEGDQSADANYYDPVGRFFYVSGSYKF